MHWIKGKGITMVLILVAVLLLAPTVQGKDTENVYVVPIEGEINLATYQFVKEQLNMISDEHPAAIIFDIDTYGGVVKEATKIRDLMIKQEVPTISFVNTKAESAGVLLTIASEHIAMAEGATIGSAETIPFTEKTNSYWVSELKATAERRGRDPQLVAAMADKNVEIEGVIRVGQLLNLNYKEAERLGFSDVTADTYSALLESFAIEYGSIVKVERDFYTRVAQYITSPYIATLLLSIGFIGLVIEVFTLGFGAGGTLSLLAFGLYFGGNYLVGNTSIGAFVLFAVGVLLLFIEATIPGFGIPGIGGVVSILASIILAAGSFESALLSLLIAIILTVVVVSLLIKYGAKSPYLDKIILSTKQEKSKGYVGQKNYENHLGKEGIVLTTLRPSGTVEIGGDRIDAVADGAFIERGELVQVTKVQGNKVVVRKKMN